MKDCINQTTGGDTGGDPHSADAQEVTLSGVISQLILPAVCVFGIVGNLLNLAILTRRKLQKSFRTLEQSANLCLISLAVSDLMFCIFAFLTMFLPADNMYDGFGIQLAYGVYCVAIINVFIMESTMLTVAMSLERYLAICFPLRQDLYLTTRRIKYVIVLTFLFSMCFNIPVLWRYEAVVVCAGNSSDGISSDGNMTSHNLSSWSDDAGRYPSSTHAGHGQEGRMIQTLISATTSVINAVTSTASNVHKVHRNTHANISSSLSSSSSSSSSSLSSTLRRSSLHSPSSSLSSPSPSPSSSLSSTISSSGRINVPKASLQVSYTIKMVSLGGSTVYDMAYRIVWALFGNFIPLILLFYFNVCLCRKIYRSYRLRKHLGRQDQPRSSSHILTITLVAIVVLFFILVAPSEVGLHVSHMISSGDDPSYRNIEAVLNLMQAINFSVNFILYCIISPYFRKTLKYMVLCGCYNIYQVSRDWKKEFETSLM